MDALMDSVIGPANHTRIQPPRWTENIVERLLIASDLYLVNWWWVDIGGHQVH